MIGMMAWQDRSARLRHCLRLLVVLLAAVFVRPSTASAQGMPLIGFVRDELGQPIEGVEILLGSLEVRARTDEYGRFRIFPLPQGLTYVAARRVGFLPVADLVRITPTDTIEFMMDRIGQRMDTVRVVSRAEAAWERDLRRYEWATAAARSGWVLTDRDIAKRGPVWTSDLLMGRPGFQVVGNGGQARVIGTRGRCTPLLIVDGQPLVGFVLNDIAPSTIKAMITYNSAASLPIEMQTMRGNLSCGVIAIISQ